eukprot:scaffold4455_cov132-Isochrysis_galbana.AAC.4
MPSLEKQSAATTKKEVAVPTQLITTAMSTARPERGSAASQSASAAAKRRFRLKTVKTADETQRIVPAVNPDRSYAAGKASTPVPMHVEARLMTQLITVARRTCCGPLPSPNSADASVGILRGRPSFSTRLQTLNRSRRRPSPLPCAGEELGQR